AGAVPPGPRRVRGVRVPLHLEDVEPDEGRRPVVSETFTLLTRPGCHLCEEMKSRALPLLAARGDTLAEVDVDSEAALAARFGSEIPVLLDAEGRVLAKARDGADSLARRLKRR